MRRKLAVAGLVLALCAGNPATPPAEDSPGWNCLTNGNRICGPDWLPSGDQGCVTDGTATVRPDGRVLP